MTEHTIEHWILSLAALVSADEAEARHWYRSEAITGLGGRTAHELVLAGHGTAVLGFLLHVLRQEMPNRCC